MWTHTSTASEEHLRRTVAAREGVYQTLKYLLAGGANVNLLGSVGGKLIFTIAARYGMSDIVKSMLDKALINKKDKSGNCVLKIAAGSSDGYVPGHVEVVRLLLTREDIQIDFTR